MPRDKLGKKLTWKEFFARWKRGIEEITPVQQSSVMYKNTFIMLIGILLGIIFTLFNLKNLWWLTIILSSAFVNTLVVQIGNFQKYQLLKRMFANNKEVENG